MAEQGDGSRSSLSFDVAELSNGDGSVCSKSDESGDMDNLTTTSGSEDLSTQKNEAASHGANPPDMPANTFPFLKLPLELRMRVYYYVFSHELELCFDSPVFYQVIDLRLLQTCRQIYEESRYEVFKYNRFYYHSFTGAYRLDNPLLPDQKSAIRRISVPFHSASGFDPTFGFNFLDLCEEFCAFISDFKGLRKAEIPVDGFVESVCIDDTFRLADHVWEEGITILQTLGLVHWDGVMIRPEDGETGVEIEGLFRLRIGHRQGTLGDPEYNGVSGNELRLLFRSHCLSWQELAEGITTDQVELNP